MATAEIITVADYVVEVLQSLFNAESPPLADVERAWEVTHDIGTVTGRKVKVFGTGYADGGTATRSESYQEVSLSIVILERYVDDLDDIETEGAIPHVPVEWVDERISFVEEKIFNPLSTVVESVLEGSNGNPLRLGNYWTENIEVTTLADPAMLRQQKCFWAEVEITFRRII